MYAKVLPLKNLVEHLLVLVDPAVVQEDHGVGPRERVHLVEKALNEIVELLGIERALGDVNGKDSVMGHSWEYRVSEWHQL
jgi:hypothetical protein